jgi:hypothetical protein
VTRAYIYTPRRQARFVVGHVVSDEPEWCDLLDLGDGSKIQEALDAAAVLVADLGSNVVIDVFLRPGVYTLAAALNVPAQVRLVCSKWSALLVSPTTGDHRVITVGAFGEIDGLIVDVPESTDQRSGDSWISLESGAVARDVRIGLSGAWNSYDTATRGIEALDLGIGKIDRCIVIGGLREFYALPDAFVGFHVEAETIGFVFAEGHVRDCTAFACDGGFSLAGNVDASGLGAFACSSGFVLSNKDPGVGSNRGPRLRGFHVQATPSTFGVGVAFVPLFGAETGPVRGAYAVQGRIENQNAGLAIGVFVGAVWSAESERCMLALSDLVGDPTNDYGINNFGASNARAFDCSFVDFALPSDGPPIDTTGSLFLP